MSALVAFDIDDVAEVPVSTVSASYPLVLDLDGTLIQTDLVLESALNYVRQRPLRLFALLYWAFRGIALLKRELATRSQIAVDLLPVNEPLAAYARRAAETGRVVVVATAANEILARKVCARFPFVSEVLSSSDRVNLKGRRKAVAISQRFPAGYVYAGDATADLAVWKTARFGVFAGRTSGLLRKMQTLTQLEADFAPPKPGLAVWMRAMRIHQWSKNGLLFLPLMLAGGVLDTAGWLACAVGVLAMGLTASATYLVNDLFDLEADRQHWRKRNRPIASGEINILQSVGTSVSLLAVGLGLAGAIGGLPVFGLVLLYCATTLAYSLYLKRIPLLDVTVLAGLFTLRLGLGAVIVDVRPSPWLMVFSMFLFLSLALVKRLTEIRHNVAIINAAGTMHGRGYLPADAPLIASLGVSATMSAILIMVLYLIEEAFSNELYTTPELLWAVPGLIGLWLGRIWLLCGRDLLNDDPVAFAIGDRLSILLGAGVVGSFAGAAYFG